MEIGKLFLRRLCFYSLCHNKRYSVAGKEVDA